MSRAINSDEFEVLLVSFEVAWKTFVKTRFSVKDNNELMEGVGKPDLRTSKISCFYPGLFLTSSNPRNQGFLFGIKQAQANK